MLRRIESKWAEIAGRKAFNLSPELIQRLQQYSTNESNADYQCLVEVCDEWLHRDKESSPTWRQAAKAMRNIGCAEIADEIMSIYRDGKFSNTKRNVCKYSFHVTNRQNK